uniref:Nitric oxide synthase n=1 Tax=Placozoa sp. H4 TaxID=1034858 RepID=A0A7G7LKC4_9METZ|nr:nitric oxide synthase [Placozoa sp. H4]
MDSQSQEWEWPSPMSILTKADSNGPSFIRLQNLLTNGQNTDTFHQQAITTQSCTSKRCLGSLMQIPNQTKRHNGLKPKELVIKEAKEFLREYYASLRKENTEAHLKRETDVIDQIQTKRIYDLTEQELTYGARLAWRNASRCIGRIQWANLHLFDARDAVTPEDMYNVIIDHLKYATNKGNLRSAITIFPPRSDGLHDFRVWNVQLIRYAGYEQPDGSVIGDPANVEFTQICQSYGWRGKGGMFDVLPLLLQANGSEPQIFEIPPELVLEVPISHPEYEWFEKLCLQWYALPAVSCLLLDIGGIEFPACPFNGWYMVTEIGRDFGDINRYNMCKPVAQYLKLDTRSETTLWRDKAIVELNRAVMYSFLKHKVTMVDHHTASNSFIQHLQNEQKLRGGCPADWVWIVPPISGSMTKVYHQEMLNYKIKPCFEYQEDPWKIPIKGTQRKFKDIAKLVVVSTDLMGKALAKRIRATILYATETGTSERYAKMLKKLLDIKFDAKVICMEDYDFSNLDYEKLVFIVTSTFGNAEAPHNGEEFGRRLHYRSYPVDYQMDLNASRTGSLHLPRRKTKIRSDEPDDRASTSMRNLKYSVFALGSRAYGENFCAFGRSLDSLLHNFGGERIYPLGEGDELCGQEESFRSWAGEAFRAACDTFCIDTVDDSDAVVSLTTIPQWSEKNFRLVFNKKKTVVGFMEALSKIHSTQVQPLTVISVTNLQSPSSQRSTILVKLSMDNTSNLCYLPGDHLSIFPCNDPEMVSQLLDKLADKESSDIAAQLEYLNSEGNWTVDTYIPTGFTLREAFLRFVDITSPPTPQFLQYLINLAADKDDRDRLAELAKGSKEYEDWKFWRNPGIIDLIEEFSSLRLPATLLLSKLPRLKQRYYSISSSMAMVSDEIHITVSVVTYYTKAGKLRRGICSNWLNSLKKGDVVPCFIRAANGFHLPEDHSTPVIMIGPGTGIAPFRSFWQQRMSDKNKEANTIFSNTKEHENAEISNANDTPPLTPTGNEGLVTRFGKMVLFFGCRESTKDDIYKKEIEECLNNGVLDEVYKAYSRELNQPKQYVQDLMKEHGGDLLHMILDGDGHIYVCGDVSMAADVFRTLQNLLIDYGLFNQEDAIEYVKNMKETGRYHEDIFGITLRTGEVTERIRKAAQRAWVMIRKYNFGKSHKANDNRVADLANKVQANQILDKFLLDRGISVDVVMRTEDEIPEQKPRSFSRVFSMPGSDGPTMSISTSFSGEHLTISSIESQEDQQ